MSASSSRGIKSREWQQGVESEMCVCVCVCVCVSVCAHMSAFVCQRVILNTPPAGSQKRISTFLIISSWLLFHITSLQFRPGTQASSSLSFHFFFRLCIFPPLASFQPLTTRHRCYAGVNCACSSFPLRLFFPLSVWAKSTLLPPSSKTNSEVNQFSSTASPMAEHFTALDLWTANCSEWATLWSALLCNCRVPLLMKRKKWIQ